MPSAPGRRSRYAGIGPWSKKTGRPATSTITEPSLSSEPSAATLVTMGSAPVSPIEPESDTATASSNTMSPLATTSDESAVFSTATVMSDAVGGSALAAASAGDSMLRPNHHPAPAAAMTAPSTSARATPRFTVPQPPWASRIASSCCRWPAMNSASYSADTSRYKSSKSFEHWAAATASAISSSWSAARASSS
jgi:hypothetical protein